MLEPMRIPWNGCTHLDKPTLRRLSDRGSKRSGGEESHANGGNLTESRDMHFGSC